MTTPIKKEQTLLVTIMSLLLFVVSSVGGLGIVWMRQQITKSAAQTVKLETRLAEIERRSVYMKAKIAQMDNPTHLRDKVKGNKLIHPKSQQIVWLGAPDSTVVKDYVVAPVLNPSRIKTYARNLHSVAPSTPLTTANSAPLTKVSFVNEKDRRVRG